MVPNAFLGELDGTSMPGKGRGGSHFPRGGLLTLWSKDWPTPTSLVVMLRTRLTGLPKTAWFHRPSCAR